MTMRHAENRRGTLSRSIARLAAIAQPLAERFPLFAAHHAIPNTTPNTRGMPSRSLINNCKTIASPKETWLRSTSPRNPRGWNVCSMCGTVATDTIRKTKAMNPKHPHKNFLNLSIVWPHDLKAN
jgi:hypothetical protein